MENRAYTAEKLKDLGFEMTDSSANFLFARHEKISGKALYERLKEKGILVRHFERERIYDFNRITIGTKDDMDALLNTIKDILAEG